MSKANEYVIVIDTNQYSGNFEREMCAYLTGQYGECGVGDDIAESERKNIKNIDWWDKNIIQRNDEYGYSRPVKIYPTPNLTNNGKGKNSLITESNYNKDDIIITGIRILTETLATTENTSIKF